MVYLYEIKKRNMGVYSWLLQTANGSVVLSNALVHF